MLREITTGPGDQRFCHGLFIRLDVGKAHYRTVLNVDS